MFSWVFSGYIDDPSYSAGEFSCTLKTRLPNIEVPLRSCQLCCNSEFGDAECQMSLGLISTTLAAGSTNSKILLSSTYPKDYWKDGVISIKGESRLILKSEGNSITIAYSFLQENVTTGTQVSLIRGCDKTKETCKSRFNNLKNFSGFPSIPWEAVYR